MFYEKRSRAMGISLLVVAMLLSIWAMTSMLHARVGSSAFDESGGLSLGTCKEPCDDTGEVTVIECYDYSGPPCYKDRCAINSLHYMECDDCNSTNADDPNCEYHLSSDPNAFWRILTVHWEDCNSSTQDSNFYGSPDCARSGGGGASWDTPCIWSGGCGTGTLYKTVNYPGHPVCD